MKACVFTLGCKMNEAESASLMRGLEERGFEVTDELGYADFYLLNTCAVTAEAEKKSRQAVARMRKFNPAAPVVVCGCAAEHSAEAFAEREGVTIVTGAMRKDKILESLEILCFPPRAGDRDSDKLLSLPPREVDRESDKFLSLPPREGGGGRIADGRGCEIHRETETAFCELPAPKRTKTRAFLRIQDGCDNFCSYCLIPYLRGRSRSRSKESILAEANACGAREIVLTGIDITSYRDGDTDLGKLLLLLKDTPARIRLGSLEAGIVTEQFLSDMKAAGNIVPHFHLSLQSGSSAVLRAMNRHYTREEYLAVCSRIRAVFPDAAITTDVIVGFPTETEEDFLLSLSMVEEAGFARVHAFPFSPREGTNAAKRKDLPPEVKKERMARMTAAANAAEEKYLRSFTGREAIALFEEDGGYTEHYIRVYNAQAQEGKMYRVRLTKREKDGLAAELIEEV